MSLAWKLWDARRTWVLAVYSAHGKEKTLCLWVAFHRKEKDWGAIFSRALDLLMEEPRMSGPEVAFAQDAGLIVWQRRAFWTMIRLRLQTFSLLKRRLVAAALLKSSRHGT